MKLSHWCLVGSVGLALGCGQPEPPRTSYYPSTTMTAACANNLAEGSEVCDGTDLRGTTCASLGLGDGALACNSSCTGYVTAGCDSACTPSCQGRQCGPDPICGLSCGTCTTGACDALGQCVVVDPDAPSVLSFNTNVTSITAGDSITFTAVVTDPDGIDDVIGGTLIDPVTTNAYGAFATAASEGAYSMTISWSQINEVRAIDFSSSSERGFVAQFHDQAGHMTSVHKSITLTCADGSACDGTCGLTRCSGSCVDLRWDESFCGSCTNSCMAGGVCDGGGCVCDGTYEIDCPGIGCVDIEDDGSHCGACNKSCPSGYCDGGRCTCVASGVCPTGETCAKYEQGDTIYRRCYGIGDGYLDGSRTSWSGEVQLEVDGVIFPVCEWFQPRNVPQIICRELHGAEAVVVSVDSDWSIETSLGVYPICDGTESRLADCELAFESHCPFNQGYRVECAAGSCTPECTDRQCGDDGCGGSCGECTDGVCSDGVCETGGVPVEWVCSADFYAAADGCDCECGAPDPDCDLAGQTLYNCEGYTNPICDDGHCVNG